MAVSSRSIDLALWPDLGVVGGREPRYAIARKFAPDIAETKLLAIKVNVGRTGTINPFAVLEPVEIGGAQVKLATLHNFDLVARKDLRVGDIVQVKRAGEVIPQIIGPVPDKRDAANPPQPYVPPSALSVVRDGARPGHRAGHALLPELRVSRPPARESRPLRVARRDGHSRPVVRAASRSWSTRAHPRRGRSLRSHRRPARGARAASPKRAPSSSSPRSRRRRRSRSRGCSSRSASRTSARRSRKQIAKHFGTMDAIAAASLDDVLAVHGIGDTIAESLVSWFSDAKAQRLIERLREQGLTFDEPRTQTGGALLGCTVVITGTLPTLSREQADGARGERTAGAWGRACRRRRASWWWERTPAANWRRPGHWASRRSTKPRCSNAFADKPKEISMSASLDLPGNALVAMTRDSLAALRAAMFRDVGPNAAAMLQEAGYAGGQAMFDAFGDWLAARGLPAPESIAGGRFRSAHATEFFRDAGWGSIELGALDVRRDRRLWRLGRGESGVPARVSGVLLHVGRDGRLFRATRGRAGGGDGSRMSLDGRRPVPVPRRERRDAPAGVRRRWRRASGYEEAVASAQLVRSSWLLRAFRSTRNRLPLLRPWTAGLYISSAYAGGATKLPAVVARAI